MAYHDFMELARARFSTRRFSARPLEQEKLDKILEAGRIAPTGANKQPQKVYVIRKPEHIDILCTLTPCVYGASTVLLVAYDDTLDWKNPMETEFHTGEVDAAIVATHMMLEAAELGVDSCWVAHFPPKKTAAVFHLPSHIHPVLLMPMGYKEASYHPAPDHEQYRDKSELVIEI